MNILGGIAELVTFSFLPAFLFPLRSCTDMAPVSFSLHLLGLVEVGEEYTKDRGTIIFVLDLTASRVVKSPYISRRDSRSDSAGQCRSH